MFEVFHNLNYFLTTRSLPVILMFLNCISGFQYLLYIILLLLPAIFWPLLSFFLTVSFISDVFIPTACTLEQYIQCMFTRRGGVVSKKENSPHYESLFDLLGGLTNAFYSLYWPLVAPKHFVLKWTFRLFCTKFKSSWGIQRLIAFHAHYQVT